MKSSIVREKTKVPLVIPHPQAIRRAVNESIALGENGRIVAEIVFSFKDAFFDEANDLIENTLKKRGFAKHAVPAVTNVVIMAKGAPDASLAAQEREAFPLTAPEEKALSQSDSAYIIRMKPGKQSTIYIVGASPLGAYYGATTLVQLIDFAKAKSAVVGNIEVQDYPDIPYRMCADWVLRWDWDVNGYDWGDGLDAFIARCKRKIDICSLYKVNMVRFMGGYLLPRSGERYEMLRKFAPELNRYAKRKGVILQYSFSCLGVDYYNWGIGYPETWLHTRESYPDGKIYSCFAGTAGFCFTNKDQRDLILGQIKKFVRENEPGAVYLHHVECSQYQHLKNLWANRCAECRRQFPDDEPMNPKGAAGAVAYFYNTVIEELKAIKNPSSGYYAAEDLLITLVSPNYTSSAQDDDDWDKTVKYWQEVGRQIRSKEHVTFLFREQYKRKDNKGLRIEEMANAFEEVGMPHGVAVFSVQGGGFIRGHHMLVSSPVLTEINRGASMMYNFNGHVHSEVQVLANVNYAWNNHAPGWINPMPFSPQELESEVVRYASSAKHSDYIYGDFLETACRNLYGEKAAPYMADMFRLERDAGALLPVIIWIEKANRTGYDWKSQAELNLEAKALVDKALAVCSAEAKEDISWLSKCLEVGAKICAFYQLVYREKIPQLQQVVYREGMTEEDSEIKEKVEEVNKRAQELLTWLDQNFQFQQTDPDGGDIGSWKRLISEGQKSFSEVAAEKVLRA